MAGYQACITAIKAAAPGLSDDDVEEVLSAIIRREKTMPNRSGDLLHWMDVAKQLTAEELLARKIEQHARQAAAVAKLAREARYDATAPKELRRAVSDFISTSERGGVGRAISAESLGGGARKSY